MCHQGLCLRLRFDNRNASCWGKRPLVQEALGPDSAPLLSWTVYGVRIIQSCPTLCDPVDCSSPGSSVYGIYRQEYQSRLPFPSPGDLPDPAMEPGSPALQADSLPLEPPRKPSRSNCSCDWKNCTTWKLRIMFYLVVFWGLKPGRQPLRIGLRDCSGEVREGPGYVGGFAKEKKTQTQVVRIPKRYSWEFPGSSVLRIRLPVPRTQVQSLIQ